MTLRMFGPREAQGIFYYSYDRGHKWEGPFALPDLDTAGLVPRTDYIVESKDSVTVFLTANQSDKKEGRVLCARTSDGGATWKFISWVTPEPPPSANYPPNGYSYAIMPSAVRLSDKDLVCAVRWREGKPSWITVYDSHDNGRTWSDLGKVVPSTGEGNPPSMIKLKDGRICLTYGYRAEPYSICAKISADGGKTWTKEIVLRNDGGNRDLGYPRTVLRPDGKVVTTYYIWDRESGPERYIGATIWDPSRIK
jgi:Neuraminidase (sialidase)